MIRILILMSFAVVVALLGGCGVDGEPEPPESKTVETGITVSGRAAVGVVF